MDWTAFGFPKVFRAGPVALSTGGRAWAWEGGAPRLELREFPVADAGEPVDQWGIDHVVLLVPSLGEAVEAISEVAGEARRKTEVRGRPTAFFLAGTLLEVIQEEQVDRPLLYGVSLWTAEPLQEVAGRWRRAGIAVGKPRTAIQEGRMIMTVHDLDAGLAVMTPRHA